jgi:hypothetical protein
LGAKPANLEKYKISELKNGRLAMLAFSGIVTQSALYDKGFPCKSHRVAGSSLPFRRSSLFYLCADF